MLVCLVVLRNVARPKSTKGHILAEFILLREHNDVLRCILLSRQITSQLRQRAVSRTVRPYEAKVLDRWAERGLMVSVA